MVPLTRHCSHTQCGRRLHIPATNPFLMRRTLLRSTPRAETVRIAHLPEQSSLAEGNVPRHACPFVKALSLNTDRSAEAHV